MTSAFDCILYTSRAWCVWSSVPRLFCIYLSTVCRYYNASIPLIPTDAVTGAVQSCAKLITTCVLASHIDATECSLLNVANHKTVCPIMMRAAVI